MQPQEQRTADRSGQMVPIAVDIDAGRVELLDMSGATYGEPFFHETVASRRRENAALRTATIDFETFARLGEQHGKDPDAFIFHVGRCGSTLLANMLAASGEHLLIKEPEMVSDLIARYLAESPRTARGTMEAMVAAALRCLAGTVGPGRYKVVKFAAWNIRMARTLHDMFPATPAVFVYRPPAAMVESMLFAPPAWAGLLHCPRELQARFFPSVSRVPATRPVSPALLFAHAWRSAAEAALAHPSERMFLLEYEDLASCPADAIEHVVAYLGHACGAERISAMVSARRTYSKDPLGRAAFDPAGVHKRPPLSSEEAAQVHAVTAGTWNRLVARREHIQRMKGVTHAAR